MLRAHDARALGIVGLMSTVVVALVTLWGDDTAPQSSAVTASTTGQTVANTDVSSTSTPGPGESPPTALDDTAVGQPVEPVADLVGDEPTGDDACVLDASSIRLGDNGDDVACLQQALSAEGLLDTAITGEFDQATSDAVTRLQTERNLFVDGVVGRETALSLGIWPDEQANVIRTPPPPPGAVDTMGYPLSSVATSGSDAPPLPPDSGSGRRLVYERAGQRVWAIDDDGTIIRSWLVSGSKYSNELPGTHQVYSRSEVSTAWNGQGRLPKMVRWLKTDIGAIGFHGLPSRIADGSMYQTEAELGTRLSGGCQRQADLDAAFTWDFAQVGTPVVVL